MLEVAHLWEEQWEAKSKRKLADISSNSVLSLRLHPQQQLVPVEQLSRALRRVLSFTVCQVGVDLNSSLLRHPYAASALLPFVAGLGPRKVDGFLRQWQQKGSNSFFSRKQLLDYCMVFVSISINFSWSNCLPKLCWVYYSSPEIK